MRLLQGTVYLVLVLGLNSLSFSPHTLFWNSCHLFHLANIFLPHVYLCSTYLLSLFFQLFECHENPHLDNFSSITASFAKTQIVYIFLYTTRCSYFCIQAVCFKLALLWYDLHKIKKKINALILSMKCDDFGQT